MRAEQPCAGHGAFLASVLIDFRSETLAPVVDDIAYDFDGKLTAVHIDAAHLVRHWTG